MGLDQELATLLARRRAKNNAGTDPAPLVSTPSPVTDDYLRDTSLKVKDDPTTTFSGKSMTNLSYGLSSGKSLSSRKLSATEKELYTPDGSTQPSSVTSSLPEEETSTTHISPTPSSFRSFLSKQQKQNSWTRHTDSQKPSNFGMTQEEDKLQDEKSQFKSETTSQQKINRTNSWGRLSSTNDTSKITNNQSSASQENIENEFPVSKPFQKKPSWVRPIGNTFQKITVSSNVPNNKFKTQNPSEVTEEEEDEHDTKPVFSNQFQKKPSWVRSVSPNIPNNKFNTRNPSNVNRKEEDEQENKSVSSNQFQKKPSWVRLAGNKFEKTTTPSNIPNNQNNIEYPPTEEEDKQESVTAKSNSYQKKPSWVKSAGNTLLKTTVSSTPPNNQYYSHNTPYPKENEVSEQSISTGSSKKTPNWARPDDRNAENKEENKSSLSKPFQKKPSWIQSTNNKFEISTISSTRSSDQNYTQDPPSEYGNEQENKSVSLNSQQKKPNWARSYSNKSQIFTIASVSPNSHDHVQNSSNEEADKQENTSVSSNHFQKKPSRVRSAGTKFETTKVSSNFTNNIFNAQISSIEKVDEQENKSVSSNHFQKSPSWVKSASYKFEKTSGIEDQFPETSSDSPKQPKPFNAQISSIEKVDEQENKSVSMNLVKKKPSWVRSAGNKFEKTSGIEDVYPETSSDSPKQRNTNSAFATAKMTLISSLKLSPEDEKKNDLFHATTEKIISQAPYERSNEREINTEASFGLTDKFTDSEFDSNPSFDVVDVIDGTEISNEIASEFPSNLHDFDEQVAFLESPIILNADEDALYVKNNTRSKKNTKKSLDFSPLVQLESPSFDSNFSDPWETKELSHDNLLRQTSNDSDKDPWLKLDQSSPIFKPLPNLGTNHGDPVSRKKKLLEMRRKKKLNTNNQASKDIYEVEHHEVSARNDTFDSQDEISTEKKIENESDLDSITREIRLPPASQINPNQTGESNISLPKIESLNISGKQSTIEEFGENKNDKTWQDDSLSLGSTFSSAASQHSSTTNERSVLGIASREQVSMDHFVESSSTSYDSKGANRFDPIVPFDEQSPLPMNRKTSSTNVPYFTTTFNRKNIMAEETQQLTETKPEEQNSLVHDDIRKSSAFTPNDNDAKSSLLLDLKSENQNLREEIVGLRSSLKEKDAMIDQLTKILEGFQTKARKESNEPDTEGQINPSPSFNNRSQQRRQSTASKASNAPDAEGQMSPSPSFDNGSQQLSLSTVSKRSNTPAREIRTSVSTSFDEESEHGRHIPESPALKESVEVKLEDSTTFESPETKFDDRPLKYIEKKITNESKQQTKKPKTSPSLLSKSSRISKQRRERLRARTRNQPLSPTKPVKTPEKKSVKIETQSPKRETIVDASTKDERKKNLSLHAGRRAMRVANAQRRFLC